MASRKADKEAARQRRLEQESAAKAATQRKQRLTIAGSLLIVVIAVAVVLVVVLGGSSSNSGNSKLASAPTSAKAKTVAGSVDALLQGIPQHGTTLGNPKAPVTFTEYGDLECPICKEFTLEVLPTLIPKYVRTGKLKIEYHSLETATREPEIFKTQQVAAYAAGKQNLGWYFIETFYHEQGEEDSGYVNEKYLQGIASQVPGLNLADWTDARSEPTYSNEVAADAQAANQAGFTGTPSFELGKTGGTLEKFEPGTFTEAGPYEAAIEKQLKS
jgi:protein-disulfide isomerase